MELLKIYCIHYFVCLFCFFLTSERSVEYPQDFDHDSIVDDYEDQLERVSTPPGFPGTV